MALSAYYKNALEDSDEAKIQNEVRQLLDEHGENHIESILKETMDEFKKRQKHANKLCKQKRAIEKEYFELSHELKYLKLSQTKQQEICHGLEEYTKQQRKINEKMQAELPVQREESKQKFHEQLQGIESTLEEKRQNLATLKKENDTLAATVEALQNEYNTIHAGMQNERQERIDVLGKMLVSSQAFASEADSVHTKFMAGQQDKRALISNLATMKEQLSIYEAQYDSIAQTAMKPEDVQKLIEKQNASSAEHIARIQSEKREAMEFRSQFEKELAELRTRHSALKRELHELERARAAAEKKCRLAQEQHLKETQNLKNKD